MLKWLPLSGEYTFDGDKVIFNGKNIPYKDPNSNNPTTIPAFGQIISPYNFDDGVVSVDIEFAEPTFGSKCFILFDHSIYNNLQTYYCLGLSYGSPNFMLQRFDGKQYDIESAFGFVNISDHKFNLHMTKSGSEITFSVNGIKVLTTNTKIMTKKSSIGLQLTSGNNIIISNFNVTAKKPKVFVIMQYSSEFDIIYDDVIKRICTEEFEYDVYRADEGRDTGFIIQDITDKIKEATVVIADITPNNPNVFYEVGYSHAINKPTILLCDKTRQRLPFDISSFRTLFYENSIGGKSEIEKKLTEFLEVITGKTPKSKNGK